MDFRRPSTAFAGGRRPPRQTERAGSAYAAGRRGRAMGGGAVGRDVPGPSTSATTGSQAPAFRGPNFATRGRQKLLAVWGQVQSYAFQVELLKRCDPRVASRYLGPVKANALTTRYLIRELREGVEKQRRCRLTALTCSLWMALLRAAEEGETLVAALEGYARDGDARAYFDTAMGLSQPCRFHADCELDTYGGTVRADVRFLHDVENVLKQLNYCHLIVAAADAQRFLRGVEEFLLNTAAAGGVVPQEVYDPSHPCSVCFEELCVTANRGESAGKRVVGKICDHVTKQVRVRVARDEIGNYLPHASHVDRRKRDAAVTALDRLNQQRHETAAGAGGKRGGDEVEEFDSVREAADAALDAHNVFVPASGSLYAVSELKFWLASSGERSCSSRGRTVDAFTDNLETLEAREREFDVRASVVETVVFGHRMEHFERAFVAELEALPTIDRLLLGGRSCSPDDTIEALIKACYDHHLSAPLLKRLADPEKAAEEALRKALKGIASAAKGTKGKGGASASSSSSSSASGASKRKRGGACFDGDDDDEEDEEEDDFLECLRPEYRAGAPPSRRAVADVSALRPVYFEGQASAAPWRRTVHYDRFGLDAPGNESRRNGYYRYGNVVSGGGGTIVLDDEEEENGFDDENEGWLELARVAMADATKRRKMYADRLTKRSLAALDRCVTEQRRELEKTLRVNVYGEVLVDAFVAVFNGFSSRALTLELTRSGAVARGARLIDNRRCEQAFDAHRFMMSTLLRRRVDPAMLPSLTHKFFQLVNGPLFDHDRHTFAQPPNTALYFSVENVGLLPHLKEELARFMMSNNNYGGGGGGGGGGSSGGNGGGGAGGKGGSSGSSSGGTDWIVSRFRGFYDFCDVDGVTAAQRLAWKYIKELILATALFSSVFRCGEIRVLRADSVATDGDGEKVWRDGIYLTYERECPLVAVLGSDARGRFTPETTVILDSDVFSLLYAMLQKMAPGAVEKARSEETEGGNAAFVSAGANGQTGGAGSRAHR